MKIIKLMCEVETDCKDYHGSYDVSEVKDGTVGEKEVNPDSAKTQVFSLISMGFFTLKGEEAHRDQGYNPSD